MTVPCRPIHVFVTAPAILAWGVERLVTASRAGIRIRGSAQSLETALLLAVRDPVDVLVVDHDEEQGRRTVDHAARIFPIVLLTTGDAAAALGGLPVPHVAVGVRKAEAIALLLDAIRDASQRWSGRGTSLPRAARIPAESGPIHPEQARIDSLTSGERHLVMVLVCNASDPGKVLADRLCISEHTLRNRLTSIYAKLGVHSRLSLHALAARHQLDRAVEPGA